MSEAEHRETIMDVVRETTHFMATECATVLESMDLPEKKMLAIHHVLNNTAALAERTAEEKLLARIGRTAPKGETQ